MTASSAANVAPSHLQAQLYDCIDWQILVCATLSREYCHRTTPACRLWSGDIYLAMFLQLRDRAAGHGW